MADWLQDCSPLFKAKNATGVLKFHIGFIILGQEALTDLTC